MSTNAARSAELWLLSAALAAAAVLIAAAPAGAKDPSASEILGATGVKGGLIVHVGGGDPGAPALTAALGAGERFLVHGLYADAAAVERARKQLRAAGLYGKVAVDRLPGKGPQGGPARLPYVNNLARLVVISDAKCAVPPAEVLRVLAPGGAAYVRTASGWHKTRKPRPASIDEWTHYLHDASNNAVAHDTVVGPPRRLQWAGSPRWARHHDRMASLTVLVSAGHRLFYIIDQGPREAILLPPKWRLIARDAFSGCVLWKREIDRWLPHLLPFKSGPVQPQRRLVAAGDRVYVTLNLDAGLSALDAATGKTIRTYDGTKATEEVLFADGVLYVLATDSPVNYDTYRPERKGIGQERDRMACDWAWNGRPRRLLAIRADSGKRLWQRQHVVVPLSLAVADGRVVFHDGEQMVCLSAADGKQAWRQPCPSKLSSAPPCFAPSTRRYLAQHKVKPTALAASFGATLVIHDGVVLFTAGDATMSGLSLKTGRTLWTAPCLPSGHYCPEDLLVVGGLAWTGAVAWGRDSGEFIGYETRTGEAKARFQPDTKVFFMHHRCYRSKATDRYLIPSRTGTEFIDPKTKHWDINHWVRGGCIYGVMPCNGLLYATPHSCACYMQSKLFGFNALAPAASGPRVPKDAAGGRLEKGVAYRESGTPALAAPALAEARRAAPERPKAKNPQSTIRNPKSRDWPTFRHDGSRSGFTPHAVPASVKPAWQAQLGGRLGSLVVADGRLFVASADDHTVHALDARSGKKLWAYTAGGRIDSPPTAWRGRVLFGSNDGYVYCLRAADGALVWRFRAAPADERLVAFEQVESVWPVPGSVLVTPSPDGQGGVVRCVAGRSMFLDGGLRLLQIDADSGRRIAETVLDRRDPQEGGSLQHYITGHNMPVALPDILSTDGKWLYMRSQQFAMDGSRPQVAPTGLSPKGKGGFHLFSPTGFVDGSWWHRSYWVYGKGFAEGAGGWPLAGRVMPAGHVLVFDDELVYGYGRKPGYYKWTTQVQYQLFAMGKVPALLPPPKKPPPRRRRVPRVRLDRRWQKDIPLHVRAMVLAGKTLFVAGPPRLVDQERAYDSPFKPAMWAKLQQQADAFAGKKGGLLWAVAAKDGEKLAELRLAEMPVFDGLIAAGGRLYLATVAGRVVCLAHAPTPRL